MNIIQKFEQEQVKQISEDKTIPEFKAGDTVRVKVRIREGNNERIQAFEGVCIARKNRGIHSSFVVRKIASGEGVERTFPLYSPLVEGIDLVRKGVVKRSKLYYMRERTGKSARIREKMDFDKAPVKEEAKKAAPKKEAKKEAPKAETKSEDKTEAKADKKAEDKK